MSLRGVLPMPTAITRAPDRCVGGQRAYNTVSQQTVVVWRPATSGARIVAGQRAAASSENGRVSNDRARTGAQLHARYTRGALLAMHSCMDSQPRTASRRQPPRRVAVAVLRNP